MAKTASKLASSPYSLRGRFSAKKKKEIVIPYVNTNRKKKSFQQFFLSDLLVRPEGKTCFSFFVCALSSLGAKTGILSMKHARTHAHEQNKQQDRIAYSVGRPHRLSPSFVESSTESNFFQACQDRIVDRILPRVRKA